MRLPIPSELAGDTLAVVMAGGSGTRLGALTRWQAKPALPFGGQYRNIDFPLSNCVNSGIRRISLLTQYKAHSLIQHVQQGWGFLRPEMGEFIELWPAQQRRGEGWYAGTADAVYQNIDLINAHAPSYVLVLAGDHVYKMDYGAMLEAHVASGAEVTVGCVEVPVVEARSFGVMAVDERNRVIRFDEKPADPRPVPHDARIALASMGIYVFDSKLLVDCLNADARDAGSRRDFGRNVLPGLIGRRDVLAYAFRDRQGGQGYWRDVGTLDSYWLANMELLLEEPPLDLHDRSWPIRTHHPQCPPPRFIGDGFAMRSIIAGGCGIGGRVEQSVLSMDCSLGAGSIVEDSVLLPNVTVGRNCRIRRAIIDSACHIPDGTVIGEDLLDDVLYEISPDRVTLVTAAMLAEAVERRQPQRRRRVA